MGIEFDFLAVGSESKGGDAIAVRYGNLHGPRAEQTVIVVDGGYEESGRALVEHIKSRYGTTEVDIVLSTHPDRDHIAGLEVVLEELTVGQLLMHQPWKHSTSVAGARSRAFKSTSLPEKLEESLREASDLEEIAARKGVPIVEPFAGMATGDSVLTVLGPSKDYYEELLSEVPTEVSGLSRARTLLEAAVEKAKSILVHETLDHETLRDDGVTSPQNNTSVISLFEIDGRKYLLTGDAGIPALERATTVLEAGGFAPGDLKLIQIPHHGSRRNVGPAVLNRLLGPKGQTQLRASAVVSAPAKNPEAKHPAKKTLNAFTRRGFGYHSTADGATWHYIDAPGREGYHQATPGPLYDYVEEDGGA